MLKYCKLDNENENEHFDTSNTSNKQLINNYHLVV